MFDSIKESDSLSSQKNYFFQNYPNSNGRYLLY